MDDPRSPQSTHDSATNRALTSPGESRQTVPGHSKRSNVGVYDRPKRTVSPPLIIAAIILLLILGIILATLVF